MNDAKQDIRQQVWTFFGSRVNPNNACKGVILLRGGIATRCRVHVCGITLYVPHKATLTNLESRSS